MGNGAMQVEGTNEGLSHALDVGSAPGRGAWCHRTQGLQPMPQNLRAALAFQACLVARARIKRAMSSPAGYSVPRMNTF